MIFEEGVTGRQSQNKGIVPVTENKDNEWGEGSLNWRLASEVYNAFKAGTDDAYMGTIEDGFDTVIDGHFKFDRIAKELRVRLEALGFKAPLE